MMNIETCKLLSSNYCVASNYNTRAEAEQPDKCIHAQSSTRNTHSMAQTGQLSNEYNSAWWEWTAQHGGNGQLNMVGMDSSTWWKWTAQNSANGQLNMVEIDSSA